MRDPLDAEKLQLLLKRLGEKARGPGAVYLVGGATAIARGWRQSTIDVDLKLDPEPLGLFEAIRVLKDELSVNVELASPDQFIPPLPGWKERSLFVGRFGPIDVYHYDFYAQALAKIERGHAQDLADVDSMFASSVVEANELERLFHAIEGQLDRYPGVDARSFAAKVQVVLSRVRRA